MEENLAKIFHFYQDAKEEMFVRDPSWLTQLIEEREGCLEHPKLSHHREIMDYSLKNFDRPIHIFTVGEGNFGKSSLINAIVRGNLAKVNFLPTTWCIHRYLFGEPQAELFFDDGTSQRMDYEQAERRLADEEDKLKHNHAYVSPLFQIDWYYNSYPALQQFVIVDTPGLYQVNSARLQRSIEEYYYQADAVLWLFDATKINRESTHKAIDQVSRFSKKVIGVINKWDSVSPENQDRILHQAQEAFGQYVSVFQPVSAKEALKGITENDEAKYRSSQIPDLVDRIHQIFLANFKLSKNINLYHSACLVFRESHHVLGSELQLEQKNLLIYQTHRAEITQEQQVTAHDLSNKAASDFKWIFPPIYQEIKTSATYRNAEHLVNEVLLDSDRINAKVKQIYSEVKNLRDKRIYDLIQQLSQHKYHEVTYDYDGSVLNTAELSNIKSYPDLQPLREIMVQIYIPPNRWNKFKEWFADTFVGRLFSGVQRNVKQDQESLRRDLILSITQSQEEYSKQIADSVIDNIHECFSIILGSFDDQFRTLFKGDLNLQQIIDLLKQQYQLSELESKPCLHRMMEILAKEARQCSFKRNYKKQSFN